MRTRFAPSPTGFLHIGGLRTALYAYVLAKQSKGSFILRIEDTDQERLVEGSIENILSTLQWAGLEPDEGVVLENGVLSSKGTKGPYIQSQRLELYREHALKLLESGHAYYAFDTKEELDEMRTRMQGHGNPSPKYDASVRMQMKNSLVLSKEEVDQKLAAGEPAVIRLKLPEREIVEWEDDIRGKVSFNTKEIDDSVLLKSDGFPTYHLAHVVDDHFMDIDVVLRGEEWLSSTPKHLLLFQYLGWHTPRYAHVPLLLNKDKSKLSKRQNDVAAEDYIQKGYLPEALLNFLALLGWNDGSEQELYDLEEMIEKFSLDRVQKSGAIFDLEKLDWLQGQWMRKMPLADFTARVKALVEAKYPAAAQDEAFEKKAALLQERLVFFKDAPEILCYYYEEPTVHMDLIANKKQKVEPELVPKVLQVLLDELETIDEQNWNEEVLKEKLFLCAEKNEWKNGQLLWPMRAVLTGLEFSPGAFEVAAALGKSVTLRRIQGALKSL